MQYFSHAKVNLYLKVTGVRDDGYHELAMVMFPLVLSDVVHIDLIDKDEIILSSEDPLFPINETNTIYRCLKKLKDLYQIKKGFRVCVEKNIPIASGFGGGSSNGATALKAANYLLNLNLTNDQLVEIAQSVGSDIPYFIYSNGCIVTGVGDQVEQLSVEKVNRKVLLVKPETGIVTKEAYQKFDELSKPRLANIEILRQARLGNIDYVLERMENDLQEASIALNPEIQTIITILKSAGFEKVLMCGSGSAVFAILDDYECYNRCREELHSRYPFVKITTII